MKNGAKVFLFYFNFFFLFDPSDGGKYQVYISSRSAKACDETVEELNNLGPGQCIAIPADLQKFSEVERLVQVLSSREKALHILVNNAGAAWGATIDEYPVCPNIRLFAPP